MRGMQKGCEIMDSGENFKRHHPFSSTFRSRPRVVQGLSYKGGGVICFNCKVTEEGSLVCWFFL